MSRATFYDVNLEELFTGIRPYIEELEEKYNITCLCGQVGGGRAMALSNKRSDNDFDIFYKARSGDRLSLKEKTVCDIGGREIETELNFIEFDDLLNAGLKIFGDIKAKYPTIHYRDAAEKELNEAEANKPHYERAEYYATKLHWFITGDIIWLSDRFPVDRYKELAKKEPVIYALDYYYTRAYGNLYNYISRESVVNTRRYLNLMWQVMSAEWILKKGYRAPNRFDVLLSEIVGNEEAKRSIGELYRAYCDSDVDKKELFTSPDKVIDEYLEGCIQSQKRLIENYDKETTVSVLIDKTPEEYKQEIYKL
ncbi:MAG: hypothetical protein II147_05180 [Lachnospiraceae bacterium]|nr:hypothetical protein [Lachnospiraceae bacterium]